MKTYLPLDLQLFAEEEQSDPSVEVDVEEVDTSDAGNAPGSSDEATEDVTKQESFAKRLKEQTDKTLAEEREKWEQETQEKYKDFEVHQKATAFLQKQHGINDIMTLKEQLELAELQEKAEHENLTVEEIKTRQRLEKAESRLEQYEKQQEKSEAYKSFRTNLEDFAKENEADVDALEKYMYDENVGSPSVALKAMRVDELEAKLEEREQDVIKRYIESKRAPKAEGSGVPGVVSDPPKTWEESRNAAEARMSAANTAE